MKKDIALKIIREMDKKSDEFMDVYAAASEKYWTFEQPNEIQKSGKLLNDILNKGDSWMIETLGKLAVQLFEVVNKDSQAMHMSFDISGKDYFCDVYQDKEALGSIHKALRNTVMMKANQ